MDHEVCAAWGFDGADYDDGALLEALRSLGSRWRALVATCGGHLTARPAPDVWSALECAAHSGDVTSLHVFGVEQALTSDEPAFPAIDGKDPIQSAARSCGHADPDEVVTELERQAALLAAAG